MGLSLSPLLLIRTPDFHSLTVSNQGKDTIMTMKAYIIHVSAVRPLTYVCQQPNVPLGGGH